MSLPEVWLRGPLPDMPPLLQPVAHALLQAREELEKLMANFPDHLLWTKPAGMASPGFHLQHLAGVLDRLFTYARGEALSKEQLDYLSAEGSCPVQGCSTAQLVAYFSTQVDQSLKELKGVEESILTEARRVGRAQLPSSVIGLYVHAAEHTMRHLGQLLVTAKLVQAQ